MANEQSGGGERGRQRRRPATPDAEKSTSKPRRRSSAGSAESTPASSVTSSRTDPLELERGAWRPPDEPPPVRTAAEHEAEEAYVPAPPELIEWTPERAAAVLRGGFFIVHTVDPVSRLPGGGELWRMTQADALEAGSPLARILNRYEPARRLAGVSDEAELAMILLAHTRRELAARGRIVAAATEAAEAHEPPVWQPEQPPPGPHPSTPWSASEPPPEAGEAG